MAFRLSRNTLLIARRLEFDCAWEEDVVLEMNVPVQIALKLPQPFEEGAVRRTGIFRCVEIATQTANLGE